MGGVALPPLDGPSGFHTALERGLSHQVEGQRLWLCGALGPAVGVVRAVNVQVVVEAHLDGQISSCQPGGESDNDMIILRFHREIQHVAVGEHRGGD